jgi:F-type H+-transporting ATPase subunit delta
MKTGLIASRYARALFQFAVDRQAEDKVFENIRLVEKILSETTQLKLVLKNPLLGKDVKKQLVITACGGKVHPVFERFIDLTLQNKREALLHNVAMKYMDFYYESKNLAIVRLTTAFPLEQDTEKKLISSIKNLIQKDLMVEKIVEPKIIGGFILEIGDVRWDGSISRQLKKIHQKMVVSHSLSIKLNA